MIKDVTYLFRLKKIDDTTAKIIKNLFRLKKESKAIKNRIEREEEDYYKQVRVGNLWNNYIEYESNCDRNKTLSVKECLNKIRTNLKDITNNSTCPLKKIYDILKIQISKKITVLRNFFLITA